ncbi:transcriptional regulator NanR [Cognatishimia activa]|uniref:Transcriptional regulator NanR n=1 Tax=Cognatishimia activa TaxID=1715691 RepID=A0A0N7MB27_9RHOB|nr:transcriptional regulator NanR [Cognatishimia activa]CUK24240.1 transcriptional regulator NanR [Cognatishimia activa]
MRISDEALEDLHDANDKCQEAIEAQDPDSYYSENERFHKTIYRESGNGILEAETRIPYRRLQPFRRQQLRFRGRMAQYMNEHKTILEALERGDSEAAANVLRGHVAIQGEKLHSLMRTLKNIAE